MSGPGRLVIERTSRLWDAAAEWIATAVAADVAVQGRCAVALAGGTTPRGVYERLARDPLATRTPWPDVDLYFGDERAVPPTDRESNYGMVASTLLEHVTVPAGQVHRMEAERADRDAAARDYERTLPEELDLLLLGMGADGHTASLFPGSSSLDERARRVLPVTGPSAPTERLTITPPVIAAARRVAVLVAGAGKAPILARVLRGPVKPHELPAQLALRGVWFVDREAAAQIEGTAA